MQLDYSIQSPQERLKLVNEILDSLESPPTEAYLETLSNYLIFCMEKEEKKQKKILTQNRNVTIEKRETTSLDAGFLDDNLITNDKNIIFRPKVSITEKDLREIPLLRQLRQEISNWEKITKLATGKNLYRMKKALIEMRKDQYIIKEAYQKPMAALSLTRTRKIILIPSNEYLDPQGNLKYEGASLCNPKVVSFIIANYSHLKEDSWDKFEGDLWYLMQDFDTLASEALRPYPMYERVLQMKIDGMENTDIKDLIEIEFGEKHTVEFYSTIFRKKIPYILTKYAQEQTALHLAKWDKNLRHKTCRICGKTLPVLNIFFTIVNDNPRTICKNCRRGGIKNGDR
jgi:hypothetical protein